MHIYTLGYLGRSEEEFIRLLLANGIKCVIDVRRDPTSKIEYFDKKHLETSLSANEIKYSFLGKELGGFREKGFQFYVQTTDFKIGLVRLKEIAMKDISAIICFERNPVECHRRFIAHALEDEGWQVTHIVD